MRKLIFTMMLLGLALSQGIAQTTTRSTNNSPHFNVTVTATPRVTCNGRNEDAIVHITITSETPQGEDASYSINFHEQVGPFMIEETVNEPGTYHYPITSPDVSYLEYTIQMIEGSPNDTETGGINFDTYTGFVDADGIGDISINDNNNNFNITNYNTCWGKKEGAIEINIKKSPNSPQNFEDFPIYFDLYMTGGTFGYNDSDQTIKDTLLFSTPPTGTTTQEVFHTIDSLFSTSYRLIVRDSLSCSKTFQDINITAEEFYNVSIDIKQNICSGASYLEVNTSTLQGGAMDYPEYGYLWSDGTRGKTHPIEIDKMESIDVIVYDKLEDIDPNWFNCKAKGNFYPNNLSIVTSPLEIHWNTSHTACGESNGQIEVTRLTRTTETPNGTFTDTIPFDNFTWHWSNGDTTKGSLENIPAGDYTLILQSTNLDIPCTFTFETKVLNNDLSIEDIEINQPSCYACNDGSINIGTISGGTEDSIRVIWSNGQEGSEIGNLYIGSYSVTVTDIATNCTFSQCINLQASETNSMFYQSSKINPSSCGMSDGEIKVKGAGGVPPYTYLWNNGSTDTIITNLQAGFYTCTITDSQQHQEVAQITLIDANGSAPILHVLRTSNTDCENPNGIVDLTYSVPESSLSFLWSNGDTTADLINVPNGAYTLLVKYDGCTFYKYVYLQEPQIPTQEICLVTVDTATGNNLVVWERNDTPNIDHYNVYKRDCGGEYSLIGEVAANDITVFEDLSSFSYNHSSYYKLRAVDSCGNMSDYSSHHKTIHLDVHKSDNNVKLYWDDYEGFEHENFFIYRQVYGQQWELIDSVEKHIMYYEDLNVPDTTQRYDIAVHKPNGEYCDAWNGNTRTVGGPYYKSNSNIEDEGLFQKDASVPCELKEKMQVKIYPNPSSSRINIKSETPMHRIAVYNISGQLIRSFVNLDTEKVQLNAKYFAKGTYILKIDSENQKTYTEKIIIQ